MGVSACPLGTPRTALPMLHQQHMQVIPVVTGQCSLSGGNNKKMNGWSTPIQPPGLMRMRLMHHQEHHPGHQAPHNNP